VIGVIDSRVGFAGIELHRRPGPGILDVAPELFESERRVGPKEDIDATVMRFIFNAGKNNPRLVDPFGHWRLVARVSRSGEAMRRAA
jgi:hypothetical protein